MENTVEKQYSKKWQTRFSFYDEFGAPNTPTYKNAFKNLGFFNRLLIQSNFIAFFFGLIYFLVLGLWRKCLTLSAIPITINFIIFFTEIIFDATLPRFISVAIGLSICAMWGVTANYAYYLKENPEQQKLESV